VSLTLDEVVTYARCSLEWFFERQALIPRPTRVADLTGLAMQQALGVWYGGEAPQLLQALRVVWQSWCNDWGQPNLCADLQRYAQERAAILRPFEDGTEHKANGEPYYAPRMTARYKTEFHNRGLDSLSRRLNALAQARGLVLDDEDGGLGSGALGEAFADCLVAAARMQHLETGALPAAGLVLGMNVPYAVDVGPGLQLTGLADLMALAPDAGEGAVVIEVHDFSHGLSIRSGQAQRDLRMVAGMYAQPQTREGEAAIAWERVARVVFRQWLTGDVYAVSETNPAVARDVLVAVARGLACHAVVPRAINGYDDCRRCAYRPHCWEPEAWSALPLMTPGYLAQAERAKAMMRQVRQALGPDVAALRRCRAAFGVLEEALTAEFPDIAEQLRLVTEARAATEQIVGERLQTVVEQARRNLADMPGDVAPFSRLLDALETEMIRMGPNDTDRQDLLAALRTAASPGKG
jgi:hypothetical protein